MELTKSQAKNKAKELIIQNLPLAGYIYIVVNKYIPNLVKVGYASNLSDRLYQYNHNTEAPAAFEYYATFPTYIPVGDKELFAIIDGLDNTLRLSKAQEWYRINPQAMFDILTNICDSNPLYGDGEIKISDDQLDAEKTKVAEITSTNSKKSTLNDERREVQAVVNDIIKTKLHLDLKGSPNVADDERLWVYRIGKSLQWIEVKANSDHTVDISGAIVNCPDIVAEFEKELQAPITYKQLKPNAAQQNRGFEIQINDFRNVTDDEKQLLETTFAKIYDTLVKVVK